MTIVLGNSALQSFVFESVDVRIVEVDGNPWFVATDILAAMKSTTTLFTAKNIIEEDLGGGYVSNTPLKTSGGTQDVVILHEAAVTMLISRSRTPMGKAFNRHLHSVILPTIRKTGKFVAHPEFDDDMLEPKKRELKAAQAELIDVQIQIARAETLKLKAQLKATPKTDNELLAAIATFYSGKIKVSVTEALYHVEPLKNLHTGRMTRKIMNCLQVLGYKKTGARHRIYINGINRRVYSWELAD